jgi:hypothetical protein
MAVLEQPKLYENSDEVADAGGQQALFGDAPRRMLFSMRPVGGRNGGPEAMKAGRALFSLTVSIAALVVACSEDTQPADPDVAVAEPTMATSDPTGADDLPERSRQAAARQQPILFTGVEFTAEQERRLQELRDARVSWRSDHMDELKEFRRQSLEARKAGDDAAFEAARDGIRKLRESAPNTSDFLDELTPEQRAQVERNKSLLESRRKSRNEPEADREP